MKLRKLGGLLVAGCLVLAGAAHAQFRTLPADGQRAKVGDALAMPYVVLNGQQMKFAPGAQIFDQTNRFVVQSALPPGAEVLYTTNAQGDVARIYVLSAQERRMLRTQH
jgi:hypothetical protein